MLDKTRHAAACADKRLKRVGLKQVGRQCLGRARQRAGGLGWLTRAGSLGCAQGLAGSSAEAVSG